MSKIVTLRDSTHYNLSFTKDIDFVHTLEWIKSIPNVYYNGKECVWVARIDAELTSELLKQRWMFLGDAYALIYGIIYPTVAPGKPPLGKIHDSLLSPDLRGYQKDGVRMIAGLKGRALLADPMGVGKTPQAAAFIKAYPNTTPTLILCPAGLKEHWRRELQRWAQVDSYICSGRAPEFPQHDVPVWIINYEIMSYWESFLASVPWKLLIADECQRLANKKTRSYNGTTSGAQYTNVFLRLAKHIPMFIPISGTPLKNCPRELYVVLSILDPEHFHNEWAYKQRYCGVEVTRYDVEYKGASHTDELHNIVSHYMIRRERKDVLPELPPKHRYVVPLDTESLSAYEKEAKALSNVWDVGKKEREERIYALTRSGFAAKRKNLYAWIDTWLEENPDEKIILVAYHHATMDDLQEHYKDISLRIDGSVPSGKRQAIVDKFQEKNKYRIMIGQMQAAGVGFTLTAANTVAFTEFWYIPGDVEQMEDRVNRITQKASTIDIYFLPAVGTIEEDIMAAIQKKHHYVTEVLDGDSKDFFGEEILFSNILHKYNKKIG